MRFIKLHQVMDSERILYVNVDHLVSISWGPESTYVDLNGSHGYEVKENPEEIFELIEKVQTE